MILQKEQEKSYEEMIAQGRSFLFSKSFDISLIASKDKSRFLLSTPVYFGSNYLPQAVKEAATKIPPFGAHQTIFTRINIDEQQFRIYLTYLGPSTQLLQKTFSFLATEFDYLANEWRIYLDEKEKNDLIWVRK